MSEKPILFTAEMILAKREGRKTVTRRVITNIPAYYTIGNKPQSYGPDDYAFFDRADPVGTYPTLASPHYNVGDLLWAKEPFRILGSVPTENDYKVHVVYGRDGCHAWPVLTKKEWDKFIKWKEPRRGKSFLFMFKSLARDWDEVVSVRAERLQDISEADAIKEGVRTAQLPRIGTLYHIKDWPCPMAAYTARGAFRNLWDSINAKPKPIYKTIDGKKQIIGYVSYPWEDVQEKREYRGKVWHVIGNPWVWRYEFKEYLRQGSEEDATRTNNSKVNI